MRAPKSIKPCHFVLGYAALPLAAFAQSDIRSPNVGVGFIREFFSREPIHFVWMALFVAFLAAAFLDWAKESLLWRQKTQKRFVRRWIERRFGHISPNLLRGRNDSDSRRSTAHQAVAQLETLAGGTAGEGTDNDDLLFYALPAENVVGQLAAAAELAVADPDTYAEAFAVLCGPGADIASEDWHHYRQLAELRRSARREEANKARRFGDLRAQFMVKAQRALDNLQIAMTRKWQREVRAYVWLSSAFLGLAVVTMTQPVGAATLKESLATSALVTLGGAVLAPFAHDIMRAVRGLPRR